VTSTLFQLVVVVVVVVEVVVISPGPFPMDHGSQHPKRRHYWLKKITRNEGVTSAKTRREQRENTQQRSDSAHT